MKFNPTEICTDGNLLKAKEAILFARAQQLKRRVWKKINRWIGFLVLVDSSSKVDQVKRDILNGTIHVYDLSQ